MANDSATRDDDVEAERIRVLHSEYIDFVETKLGTEPWVRIDVSSGPCPDVGVVQFCAMIPNSKVDWALRRADWDLSIGHGRPGCVSHYDGADKPRRIEYFRFGDDDGVEPLVISRYFFGLKPEYIELNEEFRLFHNLRFDPASGIYTKIEDSGEMTEVAVVEKRSVRIKMRPLREFLALKEMHLALYFSRTAYSTRALTDLEIPDQAVETREGMCFYSLATRTERGFRDEMKSISVLLGKKLIPGVAKEKSDLWPEGGAADRFEEFIIGRDRDGDPVTSTCDPSALRSYFEPASGKPFEVTPVFFRRDVLQKYYDNPGKYSVEDGYLRCGGLWGMRLDNNHDRYVTTLLVDLADLPHNEQLHWRQYNVPPEGGVSATTWKRGFQALFADPERLDLLFKLRFESFGQQWRGRFGWDLFRPLHDDDAHVWISLRIPLTEERKEFDEQVVALSKVLIERLNSKELVARTDPSLTRSINQLEACLQGAGAEGYESHVVFLRTLNEIRVPGAHRKGSRSQKAADAVGLDSEKPSRVFEELLAQAIDFLAFLDATFLDGEVFAGPPGSVWGEGGAHPDARNDSHQPRDVTDSPASEVWR